MTSIAPTGRWRGQPQGFVRVNRAHPLASCLDGLYLGVDLRPRDLIGRIGQIQMPTGSGLSVTPGIAGLGITNDSTAIMEMTAMSPERTSLPMVAVSVGWLYGVGAFPPNALSLAYSPWPYFSLTYTGSQVRMTIKGRPPSTARSVYVTPNGPGSGLPICVLAQIFSRTDYRLYVNGSMASGSSDFGEFAGYTHLSSPNTDAVTGSVALSGIGFGRSALTDTQALDLTRNPARLWEMFEALSPRLWVPSSGAPPSPSPSSGGSTSRLRLMRAARAARLRRDDEDVLLLLP